jgi:hypothetical protein
MACCQPCAEPSVAGNHRPFVLVAGREKVHMANSGEPVWFPPELLTLRVFFVEFTKEKEPLSHPQKKRIS